jgi:hypothetical protein
MTGEPVYRDRDAGRNQMTITNQGSANQVGRRLADASAAIRREREELFEAGRQRAVTKGSQDLNTVDLQSLEDYARGVLLSHNRDPFDSTKYSHDREMEDRFEINKEAMVRQAEAIALSRAKVRDLRNDVATLGSAGAKPTPSRFGVAVAAIVLTVTFAPTLHDTIFFGLTEAFNWAASVFFSLVFGVFLAWSMVFTYHLSGKRSSMGWLGLLGGMILAVGFLIFRLEVATTPAEQLMAVGFAIVEFGAIITLEWIGSHLRRNYSEWRTQEDAIDQKARQLSSAEMELVQRKEYMQSLNSISDNHIALVEERWIRHTIPSDLEAAALKAIHDGYMQGIAENQGRVKNA